MTAGIQTRVSLHLLEGGPGSAMLLTCHLPMIRGGNHSQLAPMLGARTVHLSSPALGLVVEPDFLFTLLGTWDVLDCLV